MRIALLADIHSNLPALQAVVNDLPSVDFALCAGDVVGYYANPNEVCALVRRLGMLAVRGNHDAYVTGALSPKPELASAYRTAWTRERLDPQHLTWLSSLPVEMCFQFGRTSVRVRHANPWDEAAYLYPDSTRLQEIVLSPGQLWVLGHTHVPMRVKCGSGFVVNPGSVGQPRDWNPMASYALLDTTSCKVDFRRVPYNVEALGKCLADSGWNPAMIAILSRSRTQTV